MKPKTNKNLLEEVPLERIQAAWLKARVRLEKAKRTGGVCRICGEKIRKGEEIVVSEDDGLVGLYVAFWSLKVRAHKSCYEKLVLPRGLAARSHYRFRRFCPSCGTWIQIFDGDNGSPWPPKSNDVIRCPYCGTMLRSKPRDRSHYNPPRIEAGLNLEVVPARGQLSLDDFLGTIVVVKKGDGEVRYLILER